METVVAEGSGKDSTRDDPYYPVYQQHRGKLEELLVDQSRSLDRSILTISSGALALSITFSDKLIASSGIVNSGLLFAAWMLFAVAILGTTLSFWTSGRSISKQIYLFDDFYVGHLEREEREWFWSTFTTWLGVGSVMMLILGIVLLSCFAYQNLPHQRTLAMNNENKMMTEKLQTHGAPTPSAPLRPQAQATQMVPQTPPTQMVQPSRPAAGDTQTQSEK